MKPANLLQDFHEEKPRSGPSRRRLRRIILMAGITIIAALCLAACAPSHTSTAPSTTMADTGASASPAAQTFAEQTSNGVFPDNLINSDFLNPGKRGCSACHDDLYALIENLSPDFQHVWASAPGYGQKARIDDCLTCHRIHKEFTGPYLGDLLHAYHYNNDTFVSELKGNCWSCHAINSEGDPELGSAADDQLLLWDEFKYSPAAGGYVTAESDPVLKWVESRGWNGGHVTEMSLDRGMDMTVDLSQPVSNEEDMMIINNWGDPDGAPSKTPINADEWRLTLEGVNNPRSFSLAELQAMPQTEMTVTQECYSVMPGSTLVGNFPVKGVSLDYLIDQCGGLVDGANAIRAIGHDGWQDWQVSAEVSLSEAHMPIVALEFWGHPLTEDQGYPATYVIPGVSGATWTKWVETIRFESVDDIDAVCPDDYTLFPNPVYGHPVSSSWFFVEDGDTFSLADGPVKLEGYSYAWVKSPGHNLKTVSFSFDYGKTWKDIDVPDNFDEHQWVYWNISWNPPEPGTYVLKVKGTDAAGVEQNWPDSVFVTIAE